ncbi:MAG: hypothetical protein O3C60_13700 [Planctomycetota bacterium]|nr:hypothetical protein [Planctomycetota bacterium]
MSRTHGVSITADPIVSQEFVPLVITLPQPAGRISAIFETQRVGTKYDISQLDERHTGEVHFIAGMSAGASLVTKPLKSIEIPKLSSLLASVTMSRLISYLPMRYGFVDWSI